VLVVHEHGAKRVSSVRQLALSMDLMFRHSRRCRRSRHYRLRLKLQRPLQRKQPMHTLLICDDPNMQSKQNKIGNGNRKLETPKTTTTPSRCRREGKQKLLGNTLEVNK
jgi:hypothetical protein